MPPAFNLSQDQTLQLISSSICYKVTQSTLAPSPSPQQSPTKAKKTRQAIHPSSRQNRQLFASCEHFNVSSPHPTDSRLRNRRTRAIPVPTLIGCKLLKSALRQLRAPGNRWVFGSLQRDCMRNMRRCSEEVELYGLRPNSATPTSRPRRYGAPPAGTAASRGRSYFHFRCTQSQSAGLRLISPSSARA